MVLNNQGDRHAAQTGKRLIKIREAKRNNPRPHKDERATGNIPVGYASLWGMGALICFVFLLARLLQPNFVAAESVVVRYPEGVAHGFLVLRTLDGKPIADGESTQVALGDRVTNRMWFKFTDVQSMSRRLCSRRTAPSIL
jgi:hypothetical protein